MFEVSTDKLINTIIITLIIITFLRAPLVTIGIILFIYLFRNTRIIEVIFEATMVWFFLFIWAIDCIQWLFKVVSKI